MQSSKNELDNIILTERRHRVSSELTALLMVFVFMVPLCVGLLMIYLSTSP